METYKKYIFGAFGTDNEIQLWEFDSSIMKGIFQKIEQYESELSYYRKESFVHQINSCAGYSYSPCNKDICYMIEKSFHYYQMSKVFNLLMKTVQKQYMEMGEKLTLIQRYLAKKNTDMSQIKLKDKQLMLVKKDMELDLGGIAKGFIVDQITELLQVNKVYKGLINFGGDIYAWNKENEYFNVGIKNPFINEMAPLLIVSIINESISTSGVYERYHQANINFHHIVDPRYMKPSNSELVSVSVIGNRTMDTDILATIFLILGRKQSLALIKRYRLDYHVIFITRSHEVYCTESLKNRIIESRIPLFICE